MSTRYTLNVKLEADLTDDISSYYTDYKPKHEDDSGFDLPAKENYYIYTDPEHLEFNGKSTGIQFGVSCCMIDNTTGKSVGYYLYPRSSFHKYNLIVANHLGIIDAGYRGPITGMVKPLHFDKENSFITIDRGTKLFQLCAPDLSHFDVKVVDELPESSRGSDGFGSTGK
jgi:dUTP pyrophosphatase